MALTVTGAHGQDFSPAIYCDPPATPHTPRDRSVLIEFQDMITEDYEQYFTDISRYIACIDRERDRAFREAQRVGEEYRQFLKNIEGTRP